MVLSRVFGWPGLLFMWLAGVDRDRITSKWERARYVGLGAAVAVTTALAFASMATALAYALRAGPGVFVPIAAIYAAAVLNFDRLVASHVSDATGLRRLKAYLPRFAMAVVIGLIIAEPLVLRIYEPEITAKIAVIQRDAERAIAQTVRSDPALAGQRRTLEERRKRNDAQLKAAQSRVDRALRELDRTLALAAESPSPSLNRMVTVRSTELRRATETRNAVKRRVDRDNANISRGLSRWEERTRKEIARRAAAARTGHGFLSREHALHALMKENPDLASRRWALTILLVLLDSLVVAFQALWPPSAYEKRIASEERVEEAQRAEDERFEKELAAYRTGLRIAAEKKRLALLAEATATVEGAMVQQWIKEQLELIANGRYDIEVEPPFAAAWTGRAASRAAGAERAAGRGQDQPHRPQPEVPRHRPRPPRRPITVGTLVKVVVNGLRMPVRIGPRWSMTLALLATVAAPQLPAAPAAGQVLAAAPVAAAEPTTVRVQGLVEVAVPRDGVTGPGTLRIVESNVYVPHGLARPVTVELAGTRLSAPLSVAVAVPKAEAGRTPRLMTYDAATQRWVRATATWDGQVLHAAVAEPGIPMIAVP